MYNSYLLAKLWHFSLLMSHECAVVFNVSISDQLTCLIELMIDIVTFDILGFNQQVSIVGLIITDLYSSDWFCYNRRLNFNELSIP